LEIIRRVFFWTSTVAFLCGGMAGCPGKASSIKRLAQYLKAEQNTNLRIPPGPIRSDSLRILRRNFKLDPERSISFLRGNPESWEKLLKELKYEK
jgi:hypothetical protein